VCIGFWWGNPTERDPFEDPGVDGGMMIISWVFRKWYVEAWTRFIWLRIQTGGRHL
jgi:hypothetical protein